MNFRAASSQGFSLLEILLVISVIAVAMGTLTLSLSPKDYRRDLRSEALNFQSLLKLLVDESIFKHKEIGLKIYEDKVSILVFDQESQQWVESSKQKKTPNNYEDYRIPAFVELVLEMEDVELFLNPEQDELENKISSIDPLDNYDELDLDGEENQEPPIEPDIYIFSSGEITAFELEFRLLESDTDFVYIISANDIGAVSCRALHEGDEKC